MKMVSPFLFVYLVFFAGQSHAINKGHSLKRDDLPQVQMLKFYNSDHTESVCTATLIGPTTILTAAHCITSDTAEFSFRTRDIRVKKFIIDPGFNSRITVDGFAAQGDLAIGILSSAVTVEPITLSFKAPSEQSTGLILGVGAPFTETRQYGYMSVLRVTGEEINYKALSGSKQTTMVGDSGGPVLLKNQKNEVELVAVNSTGAGIDGQSSKYGKYAGAYMMATYRVGNGTELNSFIIQTLKNHGLKVCGVSLVCGSVTTRL